MNSQSLPLRERIRLLGELLGQSIAAKAGSETLATIEYLRNGFIEERKHPDPERRTALVRTIAELDLERLRDIIRAFSTYFSLANIAEEDQSRAARAGQQQQWEGSFQETFQSCRQRKISPERLRGLLERLRFTPVFTAHPTEARRRTTMNLLQQIYHLNQQLDEHAGDAQRSAKVRAAMQEAIDILWSSDEVRTRRPLVFDEINNGLHYFKNSLLSAIPQIYRNFADARAHYYPELAEDPIPPFLTFGSWIGGDRDGNPFVTHETTVQAVHMHARTILEHYGEALRNLRQTLVYSDTIVAIDPRIYARLDELTELGTRVFAYNPEDYNHEPYRRLLALMEAKIRATLAGILGEDAPAAYADPEAFLQDLRLLREALSQHDARQASGGVLDLIRLVKSCGFHLAALDIRQESRYHRAVVADIFAHCPNLPDYESLDEAARRKILAELLARPGAPLLFVERLRPETREQLALMKTIAELRQKVGAATFGSYVISMTHSAADILEVLFLLRFAGLSGLDAAGQPFCALPLAPLFETIEDLKKIPEILTALWQESGYRALLQAQGNTQEIMLGYSDSSKDGGIMSSAWQLYRAQLSITEIAARFHCQTRIFHGRGGSVGRGGGPTHKAIAAQPLGTLQGQIKFTEQGEVLYAKYANPETAVFELTMGITGALKATATPLACTPHDLARYEALMVKMAAAGEAAYRELTDELSGFYRFFSEATPVGEIALLNIGSRPAHRRQGVPTKETIRAIPWVFGWSLSRFTLPAWYGVGSALAAVTAEEWPLLRAMLHYWPFFAVFISNSEMGFAKAELAIAEDYAALCPDAELRAQVMAKIRTEYQKTRAGFNRLLEQAALLQHQEALAQSLHWRDPYLDPINQIQIELLRRLRKLDDGEMRPALQDVLVRTINALAAGLRNTG